MASFEPSEEETGPGLLSDNDTVPEDHAAEGDDAIIARSCARIADFHKARDITILNVRDLIYVTTYFVIATCMHGRQMQAIADAANLELKRAGIQRVGMEGYDSESWLLIDYGEVILHLFTGESRKFYDLEMRWGDAPRLEWEEVE